MNALCPVLRVGIVVVALLLGWNVPSAHAGLIKGDFLATGDGFLITDTATQLEWLTPFYTRGHTFNDSAVQNLIATYGFRYATAAETLDMINDNFGNPPVGDPGSPAGFDAAADFFSIFGINQFVTCHVTELTTAPCPRTQGLTSDVGSRANSHLAFGMIQFGADGWLIANNSWSDAFGDGQMGSWLTREAAPSPVPEPGSMTLLGLGLVGLRRAMRRRKNHVRDADDD